MAGAGTILVLADHSGGSVGKATLELLTLARTLGEPVALWCGSGFADAKGTLAEYGAARVLLADGAEFEQYAVAPTVDALAAAVSQLSPAAVLVPATLEGKELAGRLAVRLDSGVITDAVAVADDLSCTQSIFGGSTIVTSRVSRGTPIVAVRPNSVAAEPSPGPAAEEQLAVEFGPAATLARVVDRVAERKGSRPELQEASIVVSGGRGMANGENFGMLEELADLLGGAVGASRAATDSGWYPHQYQVGQTGKTVSPQVYLAVGISGAIQHRAGMQTSKTIVAINKDPEAPIFELVDFGVVGDLFDVVPQLTEEVRRRKG